MRFYHDGLVHTAVYMTGNQHNMLRLLLSDSWVNTKITVLTLENETEIENLHSIEVLEQVQLGLNDFEKKFNYKFYIDEIFFVKSDSKPVGVYRILTEKLLEDVLKNLKQFQAA